MSNEVPGRDAGAWQDRPQSMRRPPGLLSSSSAINRQANPAIGISGLLMDPRLSFLLILGNIFIMSLGFIRSI